MMTTIGFGKEIGGVSSKRSRVVGFVIFAFIDTDQIVQGTFQIPHCRMLCT